MSARPNQQMPRAVEPGNPFTPIRYAPPRRFAGRSRELSEVLTGLDSVLGFSVVGEARIGKTSLLCYLEATLGARPAAQGRFLPIYISALEWMLSARLRVVLLLDEFKNLSQRPAEFGDVFFGALRSLYQAGMIALILASLRRFRLDRHTRRRIAWMLGNLSAPGNEPGR